MSVSVRLPTILRPQAGGLSEISAEGGTVGEIVDDVVRQFPGTASHLKAPDGGLHRFVNVYLNDEDVRYLGGLETPVPAGAQLSIVPAVAGGGG
ncbi:MAG: MoaD/ThiS family protein [Actinomycetota bacterium]|nr:MoaD/ThiS family protein [Actinomycetota bacterium]MBW3642577.1 MoaD/ThiS family protein [Actinomycetota bacterium]MDP9005288.1 MoaD/ThiS family protein [Actinomycetota bacterium]